MVWNELKRFIRANDPQNDEELTSLIFEFQRNFTITKCNNYISQLKKVNNS